MEFLACCQHRRNRRYSQDTEALKTMKMQTSLQIESGMCNHGAGSLLQYSTLYVIKNWMHRGAKKTRSWLLVAH